uniref:Uncharacterized protein n=1 Tax=Oryza sativa subsp. japonica TaxID=39947 RepID=Q7EY06_ORYSJ|nr:hypothetical protein [Oryza sativa Japonica Group]BAC99910.1 hypothetical protein [Oryza sativa Japonica Group]
MRPDQERPWRRRSATWPMQPWRRRSAGKPGRASVAAPPCRAVEEAVERRPASKATNSSSWRPRRLVSARTRHPLRTMASCGVAHLSVTQLTRLDRFWAHLHRQTEPCAVLRDASNAHLPVAPVARTGTWAVLYQAGPRHDGPAR